MILGISGKIGSGKDTVGRIIQYLVSQKNGGVANEPIRLDSSRSYEGTSGWQVKKFAGKLKQIVSLMLNIPVADLELQSVKDQVLGEEWNREVWFERTVAGINKDGSCKEVLKRIGYNCTRTGLYCKQREPMTVRMFLQELGTNAVRDNIHENAWVNALFADYRRNKDGEAIHRFPNWIITDVRFPNEAKAVTDRGGINIRVERYWDLISAEKAKELVEEGLQEVYCIDTRDGSEFLIDEFHHNANIYELWELPFGVERQSGTHASETALDDYQFDYIIENDGTLEELVEKVRGVLEDCKIL